MAIATTGIALSRVIPIEWSDVGPFKKKKRCLG
jgi:hypothetical protein